MFHKHEMPVKEAAWWLLFVGAVNKVLLLQSDGVSSSRVSLSESCRAKLSEETSDDENAAPAPLYKG